MNRDGMPEAASSDLLALGETVAKYLPVLDAMGAQLQETAGQIETAVVEVCGNFQGMADRAQTSVAKASGFLNGGASGPKGQPATFENLIGRARQTIQALLGRSGESAAVSKRAALQIQNIKQATSAITTSLRNLDDISRGNKLLAVNARIQAANVGKEASGFQAVAAEIADHAKQSTVIVDGIRKSVAELNRIAETASSELAVMAETDERSFETSRREVDDAFDEFRTAHRSLEHVVTAMTEESRVVAQEIAAAVRALQFQDRVNQRIGHVVEELRLIHNELQANAGDYSATAAATLADFSSRFTMQDERNLIGGAGGATLGGEVELF